VKRKTPYTVEAISLEQPSAKTKKWIGINQGRANQFVEHFLKEGVLQGMVGDLVSLKREVKLGNSRVDFMVNDKDYLEVKTPLQVLPTPAAKSDKVPQAEERTRQGRSPSGGVRVDGGRMLKHFVDLSETRPIGSRAMLLLCHLYDAPRFEPPKDPGNKNEIRQAAQAAHKLGLEYWQVNMNISPSGVELLDCFALQLFDKDGDKTVRGDDFVDTTVKAANKRTSNAAEQRPRRAKLSKQRTLD